MPLIRRTIRTDFTDEELQQIAEEAANPIRVLEPDPPRPAPREIAPLLNLQPHISGVNTTSSGMTTDGMLITNSGLRYIPTRVPLIIDRISTMRTAVGITGKFNWPGNREQFVANCLAPLGLYREDNIAYVAYLLIANTTGAGKIRQAIREHTRIYSERQFYEAIIESDIASVNMKDIARGLLRSALDEVTMLAYIRRV